MNADRLHALLLMLKKDLDRTRILDRLEGLQTAINNLQHNDHPDHHASLAEAIREIDLAATESEVPNFSPAWAEMVREINADQYFGANLGTWLASALRSQQLTLALAGDEVDSMVERFTKFRKAIEDGITSFQELGIGAEELLPGECEIGFMIPPAAIDRRLDEFGSECHVFELIFATFSEIVTGHRDHYRIKTISSSDLTVFLVAALPVAVLAMAAVDKLLSIYKTLVELKKVRQTLRESDLPKNVLRDIDEHANGKMEAEIEALAAKILEEHAQKHDVGRSMELRNSLEISLRRLANRIDRGFHIEIRVGAIEENADESSEEKSHAAYIQHNAKNLEYVKVDGDPILTLLEKNAPTKADIKAMEKDLMGVKTEKTKRPGKRKPAKHATKTLKNEERSEDKVN